MGGHSGVHWAMSIGLGSSKMDQDDRWLDDETLREERLFH